VERLRFHTSRRRGKGKRVLRLVEEIRSLPLGSAKVLRGMFVADDLDLADAENVLRFG